MIKLLNTIKSKFFTKEKKVNFIIQTLLDLVLLYKTFLHWNISKIIIVIYSIIVWFISILPFVFVFFIYSFFSDVDMWMLIQWMFTWKLLFNFIWNIILLLIVVIYFIIFSYSNVLLFRLNNNYIDWWKVSYSDKIYFDFKRLFKYFKLSLLNILILLVPFIVFSILIAILFMFSWSLLETRDLVSSWAFNYFTVLSLLFLLLTLLSVSYLFYKIVFSFLLISDDNIYSLDKKVIYYIKESFNRTKWIKKVLKFSTLIILFVLIISPFNYLWTILENNSKYLNDYTSYLSLTKDQKANIVWNNLSYYEWLKSEFKWLSQDDISKKSKFNLAYSTLYAIFKFIFIYGLFVMVFSSFYRRELK